MDYQNGNYVSAFFGQVATNADPTKAGNPNDGGTSIVPNAKSFEPFNYGSTTTFEQKVDMSGLGNMNDCGECHIGGGAMEYIPKYLADGEYGQPMGKNSWDASAGTPSAANRVPLRTATETGGALNGLVSSFNYLIDVFGPKGDGKGATYAAKQVSFADTGVMEMDCLVCHLKDYSWEERKHAVRALAFDASRVTGAGFGHYSTGATPSRTVVYDASKVVSDGTGGYKLASAVAQQIQAIPPSDNCASCHFATTKEKFQVEWKKRGEFWGGSEAHTGIGCMGCHERNDLTDQGAIDTTKVGTSGIANTAAANKKLSMCDPAKGGDSGFDAQWNAVDKVAFKNCAYCHSGPTSTEISNGNGNGNKYGAPNADAKHALYGLTAKIAQTGTTGVANASHLDIIDCTVCHSRKLDAKVALYDTNGIFREYTTFKITGGAMVDGTGPDEEGRLATHDTVEVERDMKDNMVYYWQSGKLFAGNLLTSFFWRDINTFFDANNDGRGPGLDGVMQTHIATINKDAGLQALTHDGDITSDEIATGITEFQNRVKGKLGSGSSETPIIRLSALGVTFKATHNVAQKEGSLGYACSDCHSATGEIFGKTIQLSPKTDFVYKSGQLATFAKVNGLTAGTDIHPNIVNKAGNRAVALPLFKTPKLPTSSPMYAAADTVVDMSTTPVSKAAIIYESTFKNRDGSWKDSATPIEGGAIALWDGADKTGGTAGWTLKVETTADNGTTVVPRTFVVTKNDCTNMTQLMSHMNSVSPSFTTGLAEFKVELNAASNGIKITAKDNNKIRLSTQADVGAFNMEGALWVAQSIKGVNGTDYADRATWLAYMKSITGSAPAAPVADIATVGAQAANEGTSVVTVTKDVASALVAANNVAGNTYKWAVNDGSTVDPVTGASVASPITNGSTSSYNFPKTGIFNLTLTVTNSAGQSMYTTQKVSVIEAQPVTMTVGTISTTAGVTTIPISGVAGTYAKYVVSWGDGSPSAVVTGSALANLNHSYLRFAKYLNLAGTERAYNTKIQFYDGTGKVILTKNIAVTVLVP